MKSWIFYNTREEKESFFKVDVYKGNIIIFSSVDKAQKNGFIRTFSNSTPEGLAKKIFQETPELRFEFDDLMTTIPRSFAKNYGGRTIDCEATTKQVEEFLEAYDKIIGK